MRMAVPGRMRTLFTRAQVSPLSGHYRLGGGLLASLIARIAQWGAAI